MILDIYFPKFADYLVRGQASPALSKLAAIGSWRVDTAHSIYASLCQQLGLVKQHDWPLAALARLGEGRALEDGAYFLVHPAHFVLQRDHFTLGEALQLKPEEAAAILKSLNAHFAQDGFCFEQSANEPYWYLHSPQSLNVQTRLLAEVQRRDVRGFMPQGVDAMRLQSMMNQAQMLLHEHPVNQAREQAGELMVNSIWIDGGGQLPELTLKNTSPQDTSPFRLFAQHAVAKGWGVLASCSCDALPKRLLDLPAENALLLLDDAAGLDNVWFEALLQTIKHAHFKTLRCHFDVHGFTFTLTVLSKDRWKFWRKTRPIVTYFKQAD